MGQRSDAPSVDKAGKATRYHVMKNNKTNRRKSAIIRKLSASVDRLRRFGVKRLGLFGSVATGSAGARSDIDILVEFEPGRETFADLMGLYEYLKELLGGEVDLVTKGGLSPYFGPHILQEVEYIEGLA